MSSSSAKDKFPAGNLFGGIPQQLTGELVEILASGADVRIERIVSRGHRSLDGFWYDQEQAEWLILLSGSATMAFMDGDRVALAPGDYLNIPAHLKHRVEGTHAKQDTVWLAVFYDETASVGTTAQAAARLTDYR